MDDIIVSCVQLLEQFLPKKHNVINNVVLEALTTNIILFFNKCNRSENDLKCENMFEHVEHD